MSAIIHSIWISPGLEKRGDARSLTLVLGLTPHFLGACSMKRRAPPGVTLARIIIDHSGLVRVDACRQEPPQRFDVAVPGGVVDVGRLPVFLDFGHHSWLVARGCALCLLCIGQCTLRRKPQVPDFGGQSTRKM